jgi:V8-like Glu-specific endopeptidase
MLMRLDSIEEQALFSTVRIESLDSSRNPISVGTGFIILCNLGKDANKAYLISNKHVLLESDSFRISFVKRKFPHNEPDLGKIVVFRFQYSDSYIELHPDKDVDIAAIDITGFVDKYQDSIFIRVLDYDMLATCNEDFLHVSQNVSFVGYPDDRYDLQTNLPLVRSATIASPPSLDFNGLKAFVVDGQVFPGSSGSPVLINITKEQWSSGKIPQVNSFPWLILGIVAQTMIRNNDIQVIDSTMLKNMQVAEVLGLGIIFKSSQIKELIDIANKKFVDGITGAEMMVWKEM